jgi:hypothetical protein
MIQTFQPRDLALVHRQVNSNAAEGKPAKLTLKARGRYRILEEAGNDLHCIQKLPAIQSLRRQPAGKRIKELAMRMEKPPSSLVTHKQVDSLDTRLAEMEGELVSNPLERNLGFYNFAKHAMAPGDAGFTFDKIGDLWNEEIQADLNSDNEAELKSLEGSNMEQDTPEEMKTDSKVPKPGCQQKKRSRQDQIEETKMAAKRAKPTTALFLKASWKDTQESADKMFLMQQPNKKNKHGPASWHLVQVDPDETNNRQGRSVGECHVKHYVRNVNDSKKRLVRNRKHWPLIREIKQPISQSSRL